MGHACTRLRRGAATATAVGMLMVPLAGGTARAAPPTSVPGPVTAAPSPTPSPSASGIRTLGPSVTRQLDRTVRSVLRETRVPGVTVGIWTPHQGPYVRSFGVADKSTGRRMSPGLYMRIGSETKTFTVTALLQLADQGKVKLDDPIGKYVGDVPNGSRITLRQLAGMRSGLYNYSADPDFFEALTSNPTRHFSPRELLGYSFRHPALFPPGQKFSYSNTNLVLLGLVVEKESGRPLGGSLHSGILGPAGMRNTLFPAGAEFPAPHAQGYTDQTATGKVADATGWNTSWGWAAGAMISTLDDLRVWARTVATGQFPDGRTMVGPALQKQRLNTPPTPVPGVGYGLGIFDVHGWVGHNGSLPGYESLTVYYPPARATLVVLLNTDINYRGQEPSTVFGEAITKIISPAHVFNLPAEPVAH
ncbi:serine hydrolase domain-containing protein [Streptomyces sp. Li-HN-5-13]|nr:serine hydrolase domain-containing protein [Streptomyces sp. Li-HN-5-13]